MCCIGSFPAFAACTGAFFAFAIAVAFAMLVMASWRFRDNTRGRDR